MLTYWKCQYKGLSHLSSSRRLTAAYRLYGTHNSGWDRHAIIGGGFGLADNESVEVCTFIFASKIFIEAKGKRFSVVPKEIRFRRLSAIVVGITNTSRGYETLESRNLRVAKVESPR